MDLLLKFHGELRWLVALAAAATAVRSLVGWIRGAGFRRGDRILLAVLTGLLDLNLVLGLFLLAGLPGGLLPQRIEHAATMLLAVVAAHLSAIWRRSPDSTRKFRNNLVVAIAVLVLIGIGVTRLRGGWVF